MATRRRLTKIEEAAIIAAYNDWDPTERSIDDLAHEHGVSRQTVYRVLRTHSVQLKSSTRPGVDPQTGMPDELTTAMARQALTVLIEELVKARARINELEAELYLKARESRS